MFEPRWAPRAQQPPRTKTRKITEQNIAKSVRASLMYQNPWFGRNNSGIFVVAMAVQITIRSGTAAALVERPSSTQCTTDGFKRTYKVCREVRVLKSDLRETNDAHVRVDVLENALGQKNQSHGKTNQQEEMERCVHLGRL